MQGMSVNSLKKHKAVSKHKFKTKINFSKNSLITYKLRGPKILSNQTLLQLLPLYVCTAVGMAGAVFYTLRLATRNPDVQWNRSGDISNEEYRVKQYKVHIDKNASLYIYFYKYFCSSIHQTATILKWTVQHPNIRKKKLCEFSSNFSLYNIGFNKTQIK